MFEKGFFGGLCDFDRDGKLDFFEKAADTAAFLQFMDEAEEDESDDSDF